MGRLGPFEENTIVVGDCLDIMARMPDGCVDLVVTDPPYGIGYVSARPKRPWGIHVPIEGDDDWVAENWPIFITSLDFKMRGHTAAFIFTRWDRWPPPVGRLELKNMIVWDKMNHSAGDFGGNFGFAHELIAFIVKGRPKIRGRRIWNVWRIPRIPAHDLRHSAEKPEALIQRAIETMSNEGDLIFDPFIGSGTTAVVADRLGRKFFGCDINPDYVEMALERLEKDRAGRQLSLDLGCQKETNVRSEQLDLVEGNR